MDLSAEKDVQVQLMRAGFQRSTASPFLNG